MHDWYPIDIISEREEMSLSASGTRDLINIRHQCLSNASEHGRYCETARDDAMTKVMKAQHDANLHTIELARLERIASDSLIASANVAARHSDASTAANQANSPISDEERTAASLAGMDATHAELARRTVSTSLLAVRAAESSLQTSMHALHHAKLNWKEAWDRLERTKQREIGMSQPGQPSRPPFNQQQLKEIEEQQQQDYMLHQQRKQQQQ